MDIKTVDYYNTNAKTLVKQYEKADLSLIYSFLRRWLPKTGDVLEIGCGSGRDARFMHSELGLNVTAVDASEEMIHLARNIHKDDSNDSILFQHASFPLPENSELLNHTYDSIVSIALIMHIPDYEIFDFAYQVRRMLKSGGVFICSFSTNREVNSEDTRLFNEREPGEIQLLFERLGFSFLVREENVDTMGRSTKWFTLALKYDDKGIIRPLDQIESIINRDNKTATYKLALLRSLCEISQTSFQHVRWHPGDIISLPLGLIVEKWLCYYWPLIDTTHYMPEMRAGNTNKNLAFRAPMSQFINIFFKQGGLNAFWALYISGKLNEVQSKYLASLTSTIARTIVKGPITYSGGSLRTTEQVFDFKGKLTMYKCSSPSDIINGFGRVYFSANIWRELCLIGHWIGEAIILRWANLSRIFSRYETSLADIIGLLMNELDVQRSSYDAKAIYSNQEHLLCVWSAKRLSSNKFDVDHIIPYSLWHNNDLWNLVPSDPKVNNQKTDKHISMETLSKRRDLIVHYWRLLYQEKPVRFENEIERTLISRRIQKDKWEIQAFKALAEAVEIIASQRGVERWNVNS